jgi:hypothetical protein
MRHPRSAPVCDDRNWVYIIYARVLLQMVEDLEKNDANRVNAVRWFTEELREVALVCALCAVDPVNVYRQVAHRLRLAGIKSWRLTYIRWQLRSRPLVTVQFVTPWPYVCEWPHKDQRLAAVSITV